MFYIISSRIPIISSDKTNRKYFKLFVSGAIFYILLHYYLNKELRNGMIEKVRKYIYYVMSFDYAIACVLLKYIKTKTPDEDEDENENQKNINNPQKLSKELEEQRRLFLEEHQRRMLQQKALEQKALEQKALEQKALEQKASKNEEKSVKSEKSEKVEKKKSKKTDTESTESSESTESEKVKSKKEKTKKEKTKTETENSETELPIYDK
jgi:type IV secretory pathway VirB10-like protein